MTLRTNQPEQVGALMPPGSLRAIKLAAAAHGLRPGEYIRRMLLKQLAEDGHPVRATMPGGEASE